ncbi:hypothetical protein F4777DRAFT_411495 [Nemania sp. FL0916]|nr:hypothetical protein F4777DRAFT_411495 [Nemania sp. FL0916]
MKKYTWTKSSLQAVAKMQAQDPLDHEVPGAEAMTDSPGETQTLSEADLRDLEIEAEIRARLLATQEQGFRRRVREDHWKKYQTRITVAARRSESAGVSDLELRPQRSSLRRAIRESLEMVDVSRPTPIEESEEMPEQQHVSREHAREQNPLSPNTNITSMPTLLPQRSSLRQAIQESLREVSQRGMPVDTVTDNVGSRQDIVSKDTGKNSLSSLEGDDRRDISSVSLAAAGSNILPLSPEPGCTVAASFPLRHKPTSTSTATSSSLIMMTEPTPPTTPPRWRAANIGSPMTPKLTDPPALSFASESSPYLISPLGSGCRPLASASATVTRRRVSASGTLATSTLAHENTQNGVTGSSPTWMRRGWHEVREIINETPSGLYLVEWEGLDPATGVKWPASWVEAKNVSAAAIRDWNMKKDRTTDVK